MFWSLKKKTFKRGSEVRQGRHGPHGPQQGQPVKQSLWGLRLLAFFWPALRTLFFVLEPEKHLNFFRTRMTRPMATGPAVPLGPPAPTLSFLLASSWDLIFFWILQKLKLFRRGSEVSQGCLPRHCLDQRQPEQQLAWQDLLHRLLAFVWPPLATLTVLLKLKVERGSEVSQGLLPGEGLDQWLLERAWQGLHRLLATFLLKLVTRSLKVNRGSEVSQGFLSSKRQGLLHRLLASLGWLLGLHILKS